MVGNHSQHHRHSIIIIFFESTLPKVSIAHQNLQELTEESTPETPGRDSKFPVTQREKSTAWGRINEPHSLYKVRKIPLEEGMATHSSILAWRIPRTQEPGRIQSTGSQRIGHN
ncbi:unnamed protein product [Rangifer tarandus platyrhynchus]|uniref:Uncharacterized protein n=2 Tax=Rangifer tarandus platyrhynchus TaxID=3082113 RepID=A0AC59Y4I3_RANTA|nr:unnamed protein product [Rangifer tarandus platyrhynchus]